MASELTSPHFLAPGLSVSIAKQSILMLAFFGVLYLEAMGIGMSVYDGWGGFSLKSGLLPEICNVCMSVCERFFF